LNERPAIAFLNQRLRGMRFHAKVQEANHPLHKVWTELSKPGPKAAFAFMRVGRGDVQALLTGIRERYPEIEGHLDPVRVASWENQGPQMAWGPATFFFVILLSFAVRMCAAVTSDSPAVPSVTPWSSEQVDQVVIELFGERLSDDTLAAQAPDLSRMLADHRRYGGDAPGLFAAYGGYGLIPHLRRQTLLAAKDAGFEDLVAIKHLKLGLMREAREQGGSAACMTFEREHTLAPGWNIPAELRAEERKLATRLVAAGLLLPSDSVFPSSAQIPGAIVEQLKQSTGFSEQTLTDAAGGKGSESVLCDYRIALLETVLRRPADVSADLLRMM
jgi:hypothetical protein